MKHTVQIHWDAEFEIDGMAPDKKSYSFGSRAELDAFMEGVAAAADTQSYEVLYDSREAPPAPEDVQMVCRDCGSTSVLRDAYAEWDSVNQEWTLENVFDDAVCTSEKCDGGGTKIEEVNLADWLKEQEEEKTDGEAQD